MQPRSWLNSITPRQAHRDPSKKQKRMGLMRYMVNMTSSGEKQFYAIALLQALFGELPQWWKMGILYDISCQLDRSMKKVSRASYSNLLLMQDITVSLQWKCYLQYGPGLNGVFLFSMHLLTNGHVSVFTTLRNMK